ncbi:MAG: hypothetical protein ACRDTF_12385, partial [Pseudonocardiaceae bacterium]
MPTVDQIRHGTSSRSTTMTCTVDGRDHLVSDQATTAGLMAGHGHYVAICGHRVVAAPLVTPPGPTCFDCETALHRSSTAAGTSRRRRGPLARWLRRRVPRADSRSSTASSHRAVRA